MNDSQVALYKHLDASCRGAEVSVYLEDPSSIEQIRGRAGQHILQTLIGLLAIEESAGKAYQ